MLKINIITPRDALSKQLSKKSILKHDLERFEAELEKLKTVNRLEGEEYQKNEIKEFLANSFGYKINTKGRHIDYAVYDGSEIKIIIEAKSLSNKSEMITKNDANRKAMHEAILYFMQERKKGNDRLCRIVIANAFEWFVFDAAIFEKLFWQNKSFKNRFLDFDGGKLLRKDTAYFYDDIAKPFIDGMKIDLINDETIECVYLDLRGEQKAKELNAIYKLLSRDYLLKAFNPNDANSLNRTFYNEFLYILGLEEAKEGGKKLIQKAKSIQNGTLYENIRHKIEHLEKANEFEVVVSIIIVWINRILFLKLLESQIYKFNGNNPAFKFLNIEKITDFDDLESLFFDVLAKPVKSRESKEFEYVPYLNSSLFERHELENKYLYISNLRDSLTIKYYPQTVLRDEKQAKKTGDTPMLSYLFEFLDAYNFASEDSEEVREDTKALISASVLGLIFEKLNGYKDGSFYTPSFITMYMAKEAIQKAVFSKFKAAYDIEATDVEELNAKLIRLNISIDDTKKVVNSITICDPAVGSGHFLVSALNELIYIKHKLGLFGFRELGLDIENDELYVRLCGEFHEYKKPRDLSVDNHRLQRLLFEEKRSIIENQLFGVDVNPNSVNITRLRLWIELLKHTYYREDGTLETLPNIDINIKCGNSLISRFGLADSLKIKNIKHEIESYKQAVMEYKENLGSKKEVLKSIENLKDKFKLTLKAEWKVTQARNAKLKEYVSEYGYDELGDDLMLLAVKNNYKQSGTLFGDTDEKKRVKLKKELTDIQAKCDEIESGKIYDNAFEWRFEFPEVLDDNGDFVGFDVVIGNPPYVNLKHFDKQTIQYLEDNYLNIHTGYNDILYYFFGRGLSVLAPNGRLSFITSNYFLGNTYAQKLRTVLTPYISQIINFKNFMVFDEASVHTAIIGLEKNPQDSVQVYNSEDGKLDHLAFAVERTKLLDTWLVADSNASPIFEKIENDGIFLGDISIIEKGSTSGRNSVFTASQEFAKAKQLEEELLRKNIKNSGIFSYTVDTSKNYLIYIDNKTDIAKYPNILTYLEKHKNELSERNEVKDGLYPWYRLERPRKKEVFDAAEKLIVPYRATHNRFAYDNEQHFNDGGDIRAIVITDADFSIKYVLALLNSKLFDWYYGFIGKPKGDAREYFNEPLSKIPLKKIDQKSQKPFIDKVDKILELKKSGGDTSDLEAKIDEMVYALYNLTQEEIKTIEGELR